MYYINEIRTEETWNRQYKKNYKKQYKKNKGNFYFQLQKAALKGLTVMPSVVVDIHEYANQIHATNKIWIECRAICQHQRPNTYQITSLCTVNGVR